jgi:putative transposase
VSLLQICRLFGYSRQAWYKAQKTGKVLVMQQAIVLKLVEEIRSKLPRLGAIKLYHLLQRPLAEHGIKMGRDKLYDLLNYYGLLIRKKRRRRPITTDSDHPFYKYSNLVKELRIDHTDQVWVSDITYIRLTHGFCYLSLVTDAFSRRIVGYYLNKDLGSAGTISALRMALSGLAGKCGTRLIHHSDRGLQYCCAEYVDLLTGYNIGISMTQNGDPYENAIAERVNGILKDEFNLGNTFKSIQDAQQILDEAIRNYNELRPHFSLNLKTPNEVYKTIAIQ